MKKQPANETNSADVVTVLSVSALEEDHSSLQNIFNHSKWTLHRSHNLASAVAFLQEHKTPVVLCDGAVPPGTWKTLLEQLAGLSHAPALIVSSRLADERLWAEALNLGAWDVLAKPFDKTEVFRAVSTAWLHWKNRLGSYGRPKLMRAAG